MYFHVRRTVFWSRDVKKKSFFSEFLNRQLLTYRRQTLHTDTYWHTDKTCQILYQSDEDNICFHGNEYPIMKHRAIFSILNKNAIASTIILELFLYFCKSLRHMISRNSKTLGQIYTKQGQGQQKITKPHNES